MQWCETNGSHIHMKSHTWESPFIYINRKNVTNKCNVNNDSNRNVNNINGLLDNKLIIGSRKKSGKKTLFVRLHVSFILFLLHSVGHFCFLFKQQKRQNFYSIKWNFVFSLFPSFFIQLYFIFDLPSVALQLNDEKKKSIFVLQTKLQRA